MSSLLEVRELTKQYPAVRAVDGVSFAVEEGICFGLLGPNGAGKTTTVEMMEGLTRPSSGQVLYRGAPLGAGYKHEVGIQFQSTSLQDFLTTREVLQLFGKFYKHTLPLDEVVRMCALGEFLDQDNRKLSGGQRQRLFLALALINDPALLFLDEPTTGLDPQARQNFWKLVRQIKAQRKTIVLTTHYMEEAYALCDRIAIMDHGRILTIGSPQDLLTEHFEGVWLELPAGNLNGHRTIPGKLRERPGYVDIQTTDLDATMRALLAADISLVGLKVRQPTLEDLFLALTGHELRSGS
jgi:ABC-2 type transport system ATP-binding protein